MREMTLGQYYNGDSILHRLDPRVKLFGVLATIIALFSAESLWCFLFLFVMSVSLILISGIPARLLLRGLRPLILILAFTSLLSVFMTKGEGEALFSASVFSWFDLVVYPEGLVRAGLLCLRVILLVLMTSLFLTYTTTPTTLTDAIERVFHPLTYLHVPVYDFAMMMTIALRFIPTLVEETDRIMCAQKARGADFSSGSLLKRARALVPILIPLFVSSFRRAGELATAMECRCYRGGTGRTRLRVMRCRPIDYLFLLIFFACVVLVFLGNFFLPTAYGMGALV